MTDLFNIEKMVDEKIVAAIARHEQQKHKQIITHFTPPTREEVDAYKVEKNLSLDVQRFMDFYTSNGWRVGKVPMKDWRAAARRAAREWCQGRAPGPATLRGPRLSRDTVMEAEVFYQEKATEWLQANMGQGFHRGWRAALIGRILAERGVHQ